MQDSGQPDLTKQQTKEVEPNSTSGSNQTEYNELISAITQIVDDYQNLFFNYLKTAEQHIEIGLKSLLFIVAVILLIVILVAGVWFALIAFISVALIKAGMVWWLVALLMVSLNIIMVFYLFYSLRKNISHIKAKFSRG
ncbi:hypothetical protein N7931_01920 [Catenovulum sp. 2E275]|uniref:hypothetical protein n=1 Tax=Catenovulum sp. 2E275 TaxID=2980497 RepID=UPI0021D2FCE2|nr:hypothetical protein [Catenovulum sp. 2E275]MCU4674376.1 hypothetical protein [Catenovulum sp. 2E275]